MKDEKGFTLIELLIVVAIIGIIAAIAIPNLLNAMQRGKQKRTMGDMRTVSTASEAYSIDNNQYFVGGPISLSVVAAGMEPTYVKRLPVTDGWNNNFSYVGDINSYRIWSWGKDRAPNGGGSIAADGGTTNFDCDIYFRNGVFLQFPDGTQN